ncbi:MAG: GNAT family N-acetyltransferase [Peptococcaceae bacterium]|nr:GNAT family N-acetyltransferase [Peptococcaceae bacterium]
MPRQCNMRSLETERLLLRKFEKTDFSAVHSYASDPANVIFMPWGPNSEKETRDFIRLAISEAGEKPCVAFFFAAVSKEADMLLGSCNITIAVSGDEAEIGWIVHRDHWKQGYGAEMGKALLRFGFDELSLRRIVAHCDAENHASWRLMESIGMRREGLFIESRPAHKGSDKAYGDEYSYAILEREWGKGGSAADHFPSIP